MDFRSRGAGAPTTPPASSAPSSFSSSIANTSKALDSPRWLQRSSVVLLFCITILIIAIIALMVAGGPTQANAIMKNKYQAVFLNNGQVYFGNIKELNRKYVNLQNIYYLQTNSNATQTDQNASTNVSLVKLGCELHAPYDQMLINYDQVLFWENLQDSGQVVKAINQYKKDNPKGQTCSDKSQNSTQQAPSTSSSTQQSTTSTQATTGGSNSATTNSTKKP